MTQNLPLGLDGGDPGIITAMAESVISGGAALTTSGAVNLVNASGASSFSAADMVGKAAGSENFIGFATQTVTSGLPAAIATKGAWIVKAGGTVTAGTHVKYLGASVEAFATATTAGQVVGKALTAAGSGYDFVLRIGY